MPIDPSIPLAANPPPDFLTQQRGLISLREMALRLKQEQAAEQAQNALRQVFSNPTNIDAKTGYPTPNALNQITAIDPNTGLQVRQNQLRNEQTRLAIAGSKADLQQKLSEMSQTMVRDPALLAYEEAKKAGLPEQAAQAAGQRAYSDGLQQLKASGLASDDQLAVVPSDFNYGRVKEKSLDYKSYLARQTAEKKEAIDERKTEVAEKRINILEQSLTDKKAKEQGGLIDDDTASNMARQYLTGDTSVLTNIGRGAQSGENIAKVRRAIYSEADKQGLPPEQIAAKVAEFQGIKAGERALGTRTAQIGTAVNEAKLLAPLALQASDKVDRTQFPTLNSILIAAEKGTGGEDVVRLGVATNSLINIYSRAISPTGVPTVSDKEHARELLSAAWAKGQYKAAVDQMIIEMNAASKSPGQTRQEFREAVTGGKSPVSESLPKVTGSDDIKKQATDAWGSYDPDKYEYRVSPEGKLQRRTK